MWTVNRSIYFSFWCGFIFSKPVCAGWWDCSSCGSYWTVSAELVINNPENTYCICITPKAFLAVDSKRKWNLGPLKKKTPVTFIWGQGINVLDFLINTEARELSVAQKHTLVRAEQGCPALSGVFGLGEVRDMRNLMFCFLFLCLCSSTCCCAVRFLTCTQHMHIHMVLLSKHEFTEEHILFMFYSNAVA